MSWTCPQCGIKINNVRRYPVRCACGLVDRGSGATETTEVVSDEIACRHRGEIIGEMNCNCAGNVAVYSCAVFTECATRKLKPGLPKIKYLDGRETQSDIRFCNACEECTG